MDENEKDEKLTEDTIEEVKEAVVNDIPKETVKTAKFKDEYDDFEDDFKPPHHSTIGVIAIIIAIIAIMVSAWTSVCLREDVASLSDKITMLESIVIPDPEEGISSVHTAAEIYKENLDSVVELECNVTEKSFFGAVEGVAVGTGFIVEDSGYIMTNYHIVENASSINVKLHNGDEYDAVLTGYNQDNDIAILKIEATTKLRPVLLGDSSKTEIGETLLTIGHPLDLKYSMSDGILSSKERLISNSVGSPISVLQMSCSLNEGNSGGPVFNEQGEVIGIVNTKYEGDTIEGISFAVPINNAINDFKQIKDHGEVTNKPTLGIMVVNVDKPTATAFHLVEGVYVNTITKGSPSDVAGIKVGDIITAVNDEPITHSYELMAMIMNSSVGDNLKFNLWRDEKTVNITVKLTDKASLDKIVENNEKADIVTPSTPPKVDVPVAEAAD